jgi:hypothetical protein
MPRPGEGKDVVPHAVVLVVPLDLEPLLATFDMLGQCPVGITESALRLVHIDDVNDTTGVDPPEPRRTSDDHHYLTLFNRRVRGERFHPTESELFPLLQGSFGNQENPFAIAELHSDMVHDVASRRARSNRSDR